MKLTNKMKNKIKAEAESAFLEALRMDYLRNNDPWWENNPETWTAEEKAHFDALGDLKDNIVNRITNL